MILPSDFLKISGFEKIEEWTRNRLHFEDNPRWNRHVAFTSDLQEITQHWNRLDEWQQLEQKLSTCNDFAGCADVSKPLSLLGIENYALSLEDFMHLLFILKKYVSTLKIILKYPEIFPELIAISQDTENAEPLIKKIQTVLDEKGNIRSNASVELGKLNTEISRLENKSRSLAHSLFSKYKQANITAETDITIRDGRLVIPVLAENKKKANGIVKDSSATGKILYIEPLECVEVNNLLSEARFLREIEIRKILIALTAELGPFKAELQQILQVLLDWDMIKAKKNVCDYLRASRPEIQEGSGLKLVQAYFPILWAQNKSNLGKIIPLNVTLEEGEQLILISGPNAGGKSVSLKTVILLQYMAQCGFFITAASNSKLGLYENLVLIAGDHQSVEDGLSTFSAHLSQLRNLLELRGRKTLFSIDEIGTGTDPQYGAPIAKAILQKMVDAGSSGIVTTHYAELKNWATETAGVCNASMLYDVKNLQPLFQLTKYKPGSSFAIELMQKNGFEESLIHTVQKMVGKQNVSTEKLMVELQEKEFQLHEIIQEHASQQQHVKKLIEEYTALRDKLQQNKSEIILQAKREAKQIVEGANTLIENSIKQIKEKKADKEIVQQKRNKIEKKREALHTQIEETVKQNIVKEQLKQEITALEIGMDVVHLVSENTGNILEIKDKKSLVLFGIIKMWVDNDLLRPLQSKSQEKKMKSGVGGIKWVEKMTAFSSVLDVRGMTAEQAVNTATNWISEGYMLGNLSLKIIHGRGTGAVRKALYAYFKTQNNIKSWKFEHAEHGGDGATLLQLM